MIWRLLEGQDVTPKYVVCGCPKHGMHLASMLVQGYVNPMPPSIYNDKHWLGTFQFNSFAPVWQEMDRWFFIASRLKQGRYYQGHIAHRQDVSDFLRLGRVALVFIYRDLRDVAVSLAHHVTGANATNLHPASAMFRAMGGFDEVLMACITGVGPFPGVVDMWIYYAPWLDEDWVHAIRYEDALGDLDGAARGIIQYGLEKITQGIWEDRLIVDQGIFEATARRMAALAARTDASPTFRKGQPGEWRETFKDEHLKAFDDAGGNEWLVRMGYEVS